ncbi:Transglutaminase-like superfamily-domain-containing protein [Dichomitus squalens]|nr:Transglutaminase-like superfamily-domain-containing protein [Dichomitus squalens]
MVFPLPVELYTHCLLQLPPQEPSSFKTVVSFLSANSVARAAALDRSIWARLYLARYTHNIPEHEDERRARLGGDWQMMFIERVRLDRAALQLVDYIRTHPDDRDAASHRLALEFSWDVWDALELETKVPIPYVFREPGDAESESQEAVPHALPRRFWAKAALGAIGRNHAVNAWARILKKDEDCTFEDALTGLSAFVDISPYVIFKQLDQLASRCRERLTQAEFVLQPTDSAYDLAKVTVFVRNFIQEEGFALANDPTIFYNPFNQFPHYFLTVGRATTLPISVNYVYSAICRRLQIKAIPTNTPRRVLCHIESPNPQQGDMLIDPCSTTPPIVFSSRDISVMLSEAGFHSSFPADAVMPAGLASMVNRAVHNAFATMRTDACHVDPLSGYGMDRVRYAASAAFATINAPGVQIIPMVTEDCPLDHQAVVMDALLPVTPEDRRELCLSELAEYTARHTKYKIQSPRRRLASPLQDLDWFIGLALAHPDHGEACVIGWRINEGRADFQVLTKDGIGDVTVHPDISGRCWTPAPLTLERLRRLRREVYMFGRFFEDAHIPREDGVGGRLIPVLELQTQFPDDLKVGARWSEQQLETQRTDS